jgi:hypothetical protein
MIDRRRKVSAEIQKDALEIINLAKKGGILYEQKIVEQMLYARSKGFNSPEKIGALIGVRGNTITQMLRRGAEEDDRGIRSARALFYRAWFKYRALAQAADLEKFEQAVEKSDDWRAHHAALKMKYPEDYNYDPTGKNNTNTVINVKEIRVQQIRQMPNEELIYMVDKLVRMLPKIEERTEVIEDAELVNATGTE